MKKPLVSIIILNWNGWKDTLECLDSLYKISYPNYEVVVVDNNSENDSIKKINYWIKHNKKIISSRKLILIKNKENYGFAKGNNIAIKKVLRDGKPKYILLLNNDTVVEKSFLSKLVQVAESDNSITIAGPKMYYYDYGGKKNVIWFGGGKISWNRYPGYFHIDQYKKDNKNSQTEKSKEVDWISGACMLIRLEQINPLLDERYKFGCEDVEKCIEAKKEENKIVYVPLSKIWHKVGASRNKKIKIHKKINEILTNLLFLFRNYKRS